MNEATQTRLKQLHPVLADKVRQIITDLSRDGLIVECVQGLRTYAEQDTLYAQGRFRKGPKVTNARGGQSYHNWGLSADLCPFVQGQPNWNNEAAFDAIGAEAVKHGLDWGGLWTHFTDRPHVQLLHLPPLGICRDLFKIGGLEKVWQAVKV